MDNSISELKRNHNIVDVIGRYVPLRKKGHEHVGVCPFHDDKHASLMVNERKQIFKCFACGEGGDIFDFFAAQGKSFQEAKLELADGVLSAPTNTPKQTHKKQPQWTQVIPAPSEVPFDEISSKSKLVQTENGEEWVKLKYINAFQYRTTDGQVAGYAVRFEDADGNKDVYPFAYFTDGKRFKWKWQGFDIPRLLYNLHLLTANPNATVLLVEGEKTADAALAEFDPSRVVVTTWMGGANAVEKADWLPLKGRKIVFFPDNDVEGLSAMLHIRHHIGAMPSKILPLDATLPKGWDAADKQWQEGELRAFVMGRMVDDIPANNAGTWRFKQIGRDSVYEFGLKDGAWFFRQLKKEPKPEPQPAPELPPLPEQAPEPQYEEPPISFQAPPPSQNDEIEEVAPDTWFRFMGYEKSESGTQSFYFYVFRSNQLIKLSPTAMSKSNLLLLAPLNWWEMMFSTKSKGKFDTDAAANYLIEESIKVGIFNPDYVRGRGAWIDGKNVVIHAGSHLIVNGEHVPFSKFKSKYIYEAAYDLGFELSQPLSNNEGQKLIELCSMMSWERAINAYFLAGWCVIAPVCGALKWRPHIWITGAAGTGKTWVFDNVVRRCLGRTTVRVEGETSEAGIRQFLRMDALPITFDEAEAEDRRGQERIQDVLTLMRSASTSDGGMIIKGSAGGTATKFVIRSCFAFASIGVSLKQQSDRSRVTVLSMQKLDREEGLSRFEDIKKLYASFMSEEYVTRLQSRTISLLPIITKNAQTFANAAAAVLGDHRAGDQVGALLAGAYSLISSKEITFEKALEWINAKDWSDERSSESNKDEIRLITHLMERITTVDIDGRKIERTVGELVGIARKSLMESSADILPDTAERRLLTLGYRIDKLNSTLLVSNTAEFIKNSLKDTAWSNNHMTILRRLKGAKPKDQTTFGSGIKSRAVEIPLVTIFGEEEESISSQPPF